MKAMAVLMIVMYLVLPVACFAHPCDSCLGTADVVDTSSSSGTHSHSQDADSCDSTCCCAENVEQNADISVNYAPLISALVSIEQCHQLPSVVLPIFIPPQNIV